MSQRLHGCYNETNMNTIHCDAYTSHLMKRDKMSASTRSSPTTIKTSRDRSVSKKLSNNPYVAMPTSVVGKSGKPRTAPSSKAGQNILRKEMLSDNAATVEVTVKTTNQRRKAKNDDACDKDLSWDKRLAVKKSRETMSSSFRNFDPLRTLHFLTRELQMKVQMELPSNKDIKQMLKEMQHALNRVPPEVASVLSFVKQQKPRSLSPGRKRKLTGSRSNIQLSVDYEKELMVFKPIMVDKASQVSSRLSRTENIWLHQQMEENAMQLETSCKKLETLCNRLQNEKGELEQMLRDEQEKVKLLRKEMDELQMQKKLEFQTDQTSMRIKELEEERDELLAHLNKLTVLVETHTGSASMELKSLIQELRSQKSNAEEECIALQHKLTLANMEKEKYIAILSIRERQINEIRTEMSQLQDVVNEQLIELQSGLGFPSSPTSQSSVLERCSWQLLHKEMGDTNRPNALHNGETVQQLFLKNKLPANVFKESPSGDSSGTSSVLHEMQEHLLKRTFRDNLPTKDLPVLDTNETLTAIPENVLSDDEKMNSTKELFEELKRQAYSIDLPQLTSGKKVEYLSSEDLLTKK